MFKDVGLDISFFPTHCLFLGVLFLPYGLLIGTHPDGDPEFKSRTGEGMSIKEDRWDLSNGTRERAGGS